MANQQSKSRDQKRKAKLKARAIRCGRDEVVRSPRYYFLPTKFETSSKLERRERRQAAQELEAMNEQDDRLIELALAMFSGSEQAEQQFRSHATEMIAAGRRADVAAICGELLDVRDQMRRYAEAVKTQAQSSAPKQLQEVA